MSDTIQIFCNGCGTRGDVAPMQVTSALRCRCGSADLGLVGVDDVPSGLSAEAQAKLAFNDTHVENYRRWAEQEGREAEHVKTLKAYEKQPGIGRAHANFLADQLYVGGGEDNWRQEGHRDAALHTAARTGPTIDSPDGYEYEPAPEHVQRAMRRRFDGGGATAMDPKNPGHYLHGVGNWWDGPNEVKDNGDGSYTYRNPYNQHEDRFDEHGYYDAQGQHTPWGAHEGSRRTAAPHGPGTGWTGPDPRRFEGWNEYAGPTPQTFPRTPPVADSTTCPVCHGSKYDLIDKGPCRECGGTGYITHPTGRGPVQSYDGTTGAQPAGGAGWRGAALQDGLSAEAVARLGARVAPGSPEDVLTQTDPGYRHRHQGPPPHEFDPSNSATFYPKADSTSPDLKTREHRDYNAPPTGPYQMDQAACPNCGHAPTELRKDSREDAWWTCPQCGPLANIDRNPEINPYSPPQGFQPNREMKTGGFLPRKKTGRLLSVLAKIASHNDGLAPSEALDIARNTLRRYPEGR